MPGTRGAGDERGRSVSREHAIALERDAAEQEKAGDVHDAARQMRNAGAAWDAMGAWVEAKRCRRMADKLEDSPFMLHNAGTGFPVLAPNNCMGLR
jgi:hypothetical protein